MKYFTFLELLFDIQAWKWISPTESPQGMVRTSLGIATQSVPGNTIHCGSSRYSVGIKPALADCHRSDSPTVAEVSICNVPLIEPVDGHKAAFRQVATQLPWLHIWEEGQSVWPSQTPVKDAGPSDRFSPASHPTRVIRARARPNTIIIERNRIRILSPDVNPARPLLFAKRGPRRNPIDNSRLCDFRMRRFLGSRHGCQGFLWFKSGGGNEKGPESSSFSSKRDW